METFSALLALCAGNSPVTSEFPAQRPVTWSFDVFFDLRLNQRLSKHSWGWFETPTRPSWRHSNMFGVTWTNAGLFALRNSNYINCNQNTSTKMQMTLEWSVMASQITGASTVYLAVCSGAVQTKHQSSASLAFVWGIHRWPVNSTHKGPVTWEMFPCDDVIMVVCKMVALLCRPQCVTPNADRAQFYWLKIGK